MGIPERGYFQDRKLEQEVDRAGRVYQRTEHSGEGHYGKGPRGYNIGDEWIWENVCDALYRSYDVDASSIQVDVNDGVVVLRGEVETRETKRAAEDCAYNVDGVKDVFTELKIKPAS